MTLAYVLGHGALACMMLGLGWTAWQCFVASVLAPDDLWEVVPRTNAGTTPAQFRNTATVVGLLCVALFLICLALFNR